MACTRQKDSALPVHYEVGGAHRACSTIAIVLAGAGLAALTIRLATQLELLHWWVLFVLLGGLVAADFASGLVHWGADTWGRDDLPVIGRLLLVPFRVHHINPGDFARRSFVDTNGEVAAISVPVLAALMLVPVDTSWGTVVSLFGLAFCGLGMLTNQIHKWAHVNHVPAPVRWLQRLGLLLRHDEHAFHHAHPYEKRYCITTGWCNRPLDAIAFFRRLESLITRLTGALPRHDDRRYEMRYGMATDEGD